MFINSQEILVSRYKCKSLCHKVQDKQIRPVAGICTQTILRFASDALTMIPPQYLSFVTDWQGMNASFFIIFSSAALCFVLILLLRPLFIRYALARPSARGLHSAPTPQGGGLAVILATSAVCLFLSKHDPLTVEANSLFGWLLLSSAGLAALGAADDIRPLPVFPRLLGQLIFVIMPFMALPDEWRILQGFLPLWLERGILILGMIWFVNLTNFMDGMDWMSVAEVIPLCGSLSIFACLGLLPAPGGILAMSLLGAMIGFSPFNKPVAGLFLGDVGSLPIGLIAGFCLMLLALSGEWAAALLLPLYYLADSGVTLLRRLAKGAKVWQPHREHFYQQAALGGWSSLQVTGCVFTLNLFLAALAFASIWFHQAIANAGLVLTGVITVAAFLHALAEKPK